MIKGILCAMAAASLVAAAPAARADDTYPTKPIRFIIDFPAGGVSDILARAVGARMSETLGQPLVYDNKPGAGGRLAYSLTANAPADGYTIGFISTPFVLLPNLSKSLAYDTVNDFVPVGMLARYPNVVLVNATSPIKNLQEFIANAKAKDGALNYGSFGVGSSPHLTMEMFRTQADFKGTHVPYPGSPQGILALMTNEIDVIFGNVPGAMGQIKAGKIKPLAVSGPSRSSVLPDVPTMNELGLKFDTVGFAGLVVPKGTPAAIVQKLNNALGIAVSDSRVAAQIRTVGADPATPTSSAEFSKFLLSEIDIWAPVIKRAGGPFQP